MNYKFTLLFILIAFNAYSQEYQQVFIAAEKAVCLKLPDGYHIEETYKGLEDNYFDDKKIKENLLIVQANNNEQAFESNITIVCDKGIFQADIILKPEISISKYLYEFTVAEGTTYGAEVSSFLDTAKVSKNKIRKSEVELADASVSEQEYEELELESFDYDNCVLGYSESGLGFYINNIVAVEDRFIYLSFKIKNTSNVVYKTDFVQFFITSKTRKDIQSTVSSKQPLNGISLVQVEDIKPNEYKLFVYKFDTFSLSKRNNIQLLIDEGEKGRRLLSYGLSFKDFYRNIKAYAP